ncbi:MAG: glutamate--tRNA ligase [bacterium]|nr:glutamate--tRNA ligase [bacterium]
MASNNNSVKISNPRVRFAPSPTGELHIGSARTALFNYLFAKRYGGTFVLRIEDTDKVRNTQESLKNLVDGMNWLGIHWDEGVDENNPLDSSKDRGDFGPYLQSARWQNQLNAAVKLIELGHAYDCDCPPQETFGTGKCKCYDRQKELHDIPHEEKSIKFRINPGPPVVVHDLIRGEVMFRREDIQDFVIVRPGGLPTYNFAVVIDDAAMEMTHIIRGEDHLSNTPKQILVYEALQLKVPEFAHIPLIHGPDGSKMSKRHGAVTVHEYKNEGFLPEAFVNYLARLGWNDDTDREIYSLADLEELFNLKQVSSSPACFDREKLLWFNGKYIRELSDEELFEKSLPFLGKYVKPDDLNESTRKWLL